MKRLRFQKATSWYPAYRHTSLNLHFNEGRRTHGTLSTHFKWARKGGGFWFGLRPLDFNISRSTDRLEKLRLELAETREWYEACTSCRKTELFRAQDYHENGWRHAGQFYTFCPDCLATKTGKELMG